MKNVLFVSAILFSQLCFAGIEQEVHLVTIGAFMDVTNEATGEMQSVGGNISSINFTLNLKSRVTQPCTECSGEREIWEGEWTGIVSDDGVSFEIKMNVLKRVFWDGNQSYEPKIFISIVNKKFRYTSYSNDGLKNFGDIGNLDLTGPIVEKQESQKVLLFQPRVIILANDR